MTDVSIIIVSFNTKKLLIECLDSIREATDFSKLSIETIVVDNASTDGTAEAIQSTDWRNLKLIQNKKNFGFSKANNIGIKEAKGKYLLFLNPDTVVKKETLKTMVDFMDQNKKVGAATCRVLLPDGKPDDACHRGFPTPWNSFAHFSGLSRIFPKSKIFADYSLGWMDLSKNHEIDACCGAFMIVRKEAGEMIRWWDEDYFWYGEDLDFCYKLKEAGWKIYFVSDCSILHYKGVSGGIKKISKELSVADEQIKKQATKARFEAMRIFYKKHYESSYPKFVNLFVQLGISLREKLASIY